VGIPILIEATFTDYVPLPFTNKVEILCRISQIGIFLLL